MSVKKVVSSTDINHNNLVNIDWSNFMILLVKIFYGLF